MNPRVVIVGAGQAGLQVAIALRQGGHAGDIVLLGKEDWLPYQRPPLSKQVLKDGWPAEKCLLRQQAFLDQHDIDFRRGTAAAGLDAAAGHVALQDGRLIDYDHLVICTGSRLNRLQLSGSSLAGVHYLRTLDDALALREPLTGGGRLVIAGGGYIGLEVAASARATGCEVDVVEAESHIMQRSALPPIADFLLEKHHQEGVRLHLGRRVSEILGRGKISAVVMDDGTMLEADALLKGIGVRPEIRWLEGNGIETGRGVIVDGQCRTNVENIYAAGDCAEYHHPLHDQPMVLESVQNAVSQGKVAAGAILGQAAVYDEVPWFWSEQFDCRFQMAGLPRPGDELVIRETAPNSVSVLSLGPNRLHAVQSINAPGDYMVGRKLIGLRDTVDIDRLRDPTTELKELLC